MRHLGETSREREREKGEGEGVRYLGEIWREYRTDSSARTQISRICNTTTTVQMK